MEMVDIGCDTELRLRLGGESRSKGEREQQQQQKQITLFYNDQMRVCDVTETQARAIISMAKLEMEDRVKNQYKQQQQQQQQWKSSSSSQDLLSIPPRMLNRQLSMKRSLQQFLQERKTRRTSISPNSRRA